MVYTNPFTLDRHWLKAVRPLTAKGMMAHIKTSAGVTECKYDFTNQQSLKKVITNKFIKDSKC